MPGTSETHSIHTEILWTIVVLVIIRLETGIFRDIQKKIGNTDYQS